MNIMMAGNEKVYFGIELAIYSTMFHNKNVHWYIVSMDYDQIQEEYGMVMPFRQLDQWQKEKLVKIVKYFDPINSSITFIDAAEEYEKYLVNCGREVRVVGMEDEIKGIATGINNDGELLLNVGDNTITIRAGEVSVRGIYGYV